MFYSLLPAPQRHFQQAVLATLLLLGFTMSAQNDTPRTSIPLDFLGHRDHRTHEVKGATEFEVTEVECTSSWENVRPLTEINADLAGGGYPYISADGLRIYFTKSVNGIENLYYVSRTSMNDNFGSVQLLSSSFPDDASGSWLTNDELELYYRKYDIIYYTSRPSISAPFSVPEPLTLIGNIHDFIHGISLTPDKQELYLFNASTGYNILKFDRVGALAYVLADTLNVPLGYDPLPGQLSKDGLTYTFALFDTATDTSKLCQMTRNSLLEDLGALCIFDNSVNDDFLLQTQPSVTADGNTMVWVKNNNNLWNGNAFYIATRQPSSRVNERINDNLSIYPNPAKDVLFVNGLTEKATVSIYNSSGQFISTQPVEHNSIDIHDYPNGGYLLKLATPAAMVTKLVVKQ